MNNKFLHSTSLVIASLLILSGCASRTDGGARVRPLGNQSYNTQNPVLQPGTPLDDGTSTNPYYPDSSSEVVQFPDYNGQGQTYSPVPDQGQTSTGNTPSSSQALIPGQTNQNTYTPSQNQTNAVQTLLNEANQAVRDGQLDRAASALDRAVRLEPRNASIWYDLAQIRLHQGRYAQSEQMAKKSIDFASGNTSLVKKNWELISAARKAQGNTSGAQEALRNAQ